MRVEGKATKPLSVLIFQGAVTDAQPDRFTAGGLTVQVTGATFRYFNNTVVMDLAHPQVQIRYIW